MARDGFTFGDYLFISTSLALLIIFQKSAAAYEHERRINRYRRHGWCCCSEFRRSPAQAVAWLCPAHGHQVHSQPRAAAADIAVRGPR